MQTAGGPYECAGRITTPDVLTAHFEFETCPVTWWRTIWGAEAHDPEIDNGVFFHVGTQTVFAPMAGES